MKAPIVLSLVLGDGDTTGSSPVTWEAKQGGGSRWRVRRGSRIWLGASSLYQTSIVKNLRRKGERVVCKMMEGANFFHLGSG